MKGLGFAGIIFGIIVCVVALMMTTTVDTPSNYSSGMFIPSSSVHNLGLLQAQQLAFTAGLALFVAGAIVAALGQAVEALSRVTTNLPLTQHEPIDHDAATAPLPAWDSVDQNKADNFAFQIAIVLAIVIAGIVAFTVFGGGIYQKDAATAAIEANADMLADNMEMQADNMDALADALARTK
jgi:hypothetical protein